MKFAINKVNSTMGDREWAWVILAASAVMLWSTWGIIS